MCLIARFLLFAVVSFILGLLFALTCRGIVIIILRLRLVIIAIIVIIVALLIRLCLTLLFTTR